MANQDYWSVLAKKLAVELGFNPNAKVRIRKAAQDFNPATNEHQITIKLFIEHPKKNITEKDNSNNEMKFIKELLEL